MSERNLQDAVVELAKILDWQVAHFRPARTADGWRTAVQGDVGFPDLVLLKAPRLLFVELKAKGKNPDFAQATWLNSLGAVPHVEQYVWRPIDWEAGRIEDCLRWTPA